MHINAHLQLLNGWKPPIVAYLTNKKLYSGSQLKERCYYYLFKTGGGQKHRYDFEIKTNFSFGHNLRLFKVSTCET